MAGQRRQITDEGLALIKRWEGLRLQAYLCPAGVWTIGYGHTGPDVTPGLVITEAYAEALLRQDLRTFEDGVSRLVTAPLTDNQFSALVSLAFNIGLGAFARSTLLRKLNAGDYAGAQAQFHVWNKAGGKVLPGLVNRRAGEAALFGRGERVESAYIQPDAPPSERAVRGAEVGGGTAAALGAAATALTDTATALTGMPSPVIKVLATVLVLAGVVLMVWARMKGART